MEGSMFDEFRSLFPELAGTETRYLTVPQGQKIPADVYAWCETFCADVACDCRRVMIAVRAQSHGWESIATLGYGWENRAYYLRWFGCEDESIDTLVGFQLPPMTRQLDMQVSTEMLACFEAAVRGDVAYRERLQKHYGLFKKAIERQARTAFSLARTMPRVGRNDACLCGSGQKYKRCCLGPATLELAVR
jgi:hypothetical protein